MIDRISIDGVVYALTPTEAPALGDKVITVDGVIYVIGDRIVEAVAEAGGEVDRTRVNGNLYDLRDKVILPQVNANATDIANEIARATSAESELLKRIKGTSTNSSSWEETINLGFYSDLNSLISKLDGMHTTDSAKQGKVCGFFSANVSSTRLLIINNCTYWGGEYFQQAVVGSVYINNKGGLGLTSDKISFAYRTYTKDSGWTVWKSVGGGSAATSVANVDMEEIESMRTTIATLQSEIEQLKSKIQ